MSQRFLPTQIKYILPFKHILSWVNFVFILIISMSVFRLEISKKKARCFHGLRTTDFSLLLYPVCMQSQCLYDFVANVYIIHICSNAK